LKPYNINVVIIEPGIIKTEFGEVMYGPLESYAQSGPYAKMSKDLLASSEKTYRKFGAGPEIIAVWYPKPLTAEGLKPVMLQGRSRVFRSRLAVF
jgi:hypothetical protein